MNENNPEHETDSQGWFVSCIEHTAEFFESIERLLSVLAGLALAVIFFCIPFTEIGKDDPWYFWAFSGVIALAVSVLLAWVFFPPKKKKK